MSNENIAVLNQSEPEATDPEQKEYIVIRSEGEIDVNSFLLLGNSTKRGNDKLIGEFGSGLKYSIAKLLELGIKFHTFSGVDRIDFKTQKVNFRENDFDVIYVNGQKTNFTTQMGPKWKPFDALREIYSNALDEGLVEFTTHTEFVEPKDGETTFVLEMNSDLKKVMRKKTLYFSHFRNDVLHEIKWKEGYSLKVYPSNGEGTRIYKSGFLVYENRDQIARYHYDYSQANINESRQLISISQTSDSMSTVIAKYAERHFLKEFFSYNKHDKYNPDVFESSWDWWIFSNFSENWNNLFKGKRLVSDDSYSFFKDHVERLGEYYVIPKRLLKKIKKSSEEVRVYGGEGSDKTNEYVALEKLPQEWIDKVLRETEFFSRAGCPIPYSIIVAKFHEEKVAGTINLADNQIVLSEKLFDKETESSTNIRETIYEEYAHLESRQPDTSLGFQDFLLKQALKYMSLYEKK